MNDGETMALLKRFDTLEVATADLADAVGIYRGNFGLELKAGSESGSATLKVGGAEIRLNPRRGSGDDRSQWGRVGDTLAGGRGRRAGRGGAERRGLEPAAEDR